MFEPKCLQTPGCQKVTANSDIAGYFAVITGYKLAGISDKSGNTIREKKQVKNSFVSVMHCMYFAMCNLSYDICKLGGHK